jgi:hypothetical protein
MPNVINGTSTGSGGLITTGDDSGILNIQTNETTAIAIDASQAVTIQGLTVGKGAGAVATNTAVGASALAANTTGANNTGIGNNALVSNTTGNRNSSVGRSALGSATTGSDNSALGYFALQNTTTGASNIAVGVSALESNTTGTSNTAVGYQAGYTNQSGSISTYLGVSAGYLSTGNYNTFVGSQAGYNTTGSGNTFIGVGPTLNGAGWAVTTGSKNTIIGGYTGNNGGLDIRTASNYIVLSDGDGNPYFYLSQASGAARTLAFNGTNFFPVTDNAISCGFSANRWSVVYAATGAINTSDANQKQDIANLDDAEKRVAVAIKSLIKKYRFKDAVAKKGDAARIHIGAVAQEVQAAFVAEGLDPAQYALFCSDTWYEVNGKAAEPATPYTAETPNAVEVTRLGLRYEELLAFVIAAM